MKIITLFTLCALSVLNAYSAESQRLSIGHYEGTNDSGENVYDASALNMSPVAWTHVQSGSQTIYDALELGEMQKSEITSVRFKFYHGGYAAYSDYTTRLRVYLQELDVNEFQKNDSGDYLWFNVDEKSPNADIEWEWTFDDIIASECCDREIVLPLSVPYTYTGKHLLVTVAQDNAEGMYLEGFTTMFYWCDTKPMYCTAVFGSDRGIGLFDAMNTNPVIYQSNSLMMKNAPAISFEYTPSESSSVSAEKADVYKVVGKADAATVYLNEPAAVKVYNMAGQLFYSGNMSAGNHDIELTKGIYVISVGTDMSKVVVR